MSWDNLHHHYNAQDWSKIPSIFAKEAREYFPHTGKLIELWAGIWQDSRFFASLWYSVDSTDFSSTAVDMNTKESSSEITHGNYETFVLDACTDLQQIPDEQYDIVYAHLSLHYFSLDTTIDILNNAYRILRKWWVIAVLLNTIKDPEYGNWIKIETDFFEIPWKTQKRYFSQESAEELFWAHFDTIICDDAGETYKDSEKWIHNLIRYLWKKIQLVAPGVVLIHSM